jgi:hypothetical protein
MLKKALPSATENIYELIEEHILECIRENTAASSAGGVIESGQEEVKPNGRFYLEHRSHGSSHRPRIWRGWLGYNV